MAATNKIAGSQSPLKDLKPPVEIPDPWRYVWWSLAILLGLALGYWAWRYWRKKQSERPAEPIVPPHIRARQRLDVALSLINQPREFCIAVSDIVRWYLEEQLELRAPERTTEEFLNELRGSHKLSGPLKESLGEFLQSCDLVKFARYEPAQTELRNLHSAAMNLVEETEPRAIAPGAAAVSDGVSSGQP
jgi:hypothetical protein